MGTTVAFVGFRHGHILSLYQALKGRSDVQIAAACEEDAETRGALASQGVTVTHASYEKMLAEVPCDVVACGDYFGIRGARLIQAMEAGRHVLSDKPLCTRIEELDRIEALAAAKKLCVGCMLDLVSEAVYVTLRRIVRSGMIGEVHSIHFDGQHPLNYGTRPQWYFEPGKHGGTLNDIAIHAIDAIPWMTGRAIVEVTAARAWNARLKECPSFQDAAIAMLRLDNGCGVLGDVSYLVPEAQGYSLPTSWRFSFWGSEGFTEAGHSSKTITVYGKHDAQPREITLDPSRSAGYLEDFLADRAGSPNPDGLDTARVLHSTRVALLAQRAADTGVFPAGVPGVHT